HDFLALFQDLFDLFGKDLLAARIDALRAATQQADSAVRVDRREISRDDEVLTVDDPERGRRLRIVLVVADWNDSRPGQHAALARARYDGAPGVGEDPGPRAEPEG